MAYAARAFPRPYTTTKSSAPGLRKWKARAHSSGAHSSARGSASAGRCTDPWMEPYSARSSYRRTSMTVTRGAPCAAPYSPSSASASRPIVSSSGTARAEALADLLEGEGIEAVWSSDYVRTRSTAKPLADRLGADVQTYDPSDLPGFAQTLESRGETALDRACGRAASLWQWQ